MRILNRYLTRTYLGMIATCLGAFISIYLVVDFLERFGKYSRAGGSVPVILSYFLCKIPEMISQTTPMAVLMGTILAIGALSRSSEITAMRSSGVSLFQLGRPLVATAALISLGLLFMQEFVTPVANERMNYIETVLIKKKGSNALFRQDNIWHRSDNLIMQAKLYNPAQSTLSGITIWEVDSSLKPLSRRDAATAVPIANGWQLKDVTKRDFGSTSSELTTLPAEFTRIDLAPADLKVAAKSAEDMGFTALAKYCQSISNSGYDATRYLTMLHAKISLPFAALIMAFLGIPFPLRDGRSGGVGVGIGFSILIGFSYFIINAFLLSLGQAGALHPAIAAWSANLIFAAAGLWFTLTVDS
ncbi:MAG: LPS export ABC transporter permease LptG [Geobacter sp.]|nr:LPS export ABC transporter permease LptG [Geobacter sp.]